MKLTTKFLVLIAVFAIGFGVFTFQGDIFAPEQTYAQGTCGACGDPGGPGDPGDPGGPGDPQPPTPPTCNLSLNVTEVANIGDSYRLEWNGGPSSATFFINGTEVSDSGYANFTFTGPNYDRFRMVGNNGGATCQADVEVIRTVTLPPSCDSFTVSPAVLPAGGGTVTLDWATTNATLAEIDGQRVAGSGTWDYDGTVITSNQTFTLNLSNSEGSDSCTASVVVEDPTPAPQCLSFTANPANILVGESTTLNWEVANATRVAINNGIGEVTGTSFGPVSLFADTTYTLTVFGEAGTTPVSCTTDVLVTETPVPVCSAFDIAQTVVLPGANFTASWATTDVSAVSIDNGIGNVAVSGTNETFVAPTAVGTYTYTLTYDGQTDNLCVDTLVVAQDTVTTPAIDINKRDANDGDDTQTVSVGGTANFEIIVTNTGTEDLVNVVVTDPLEPACNQTIGSLAIGASQTYTCDSTNVQTAFTNVANVTGDSAVDGATVTDTDPTNVLVASTPVLTCSDISINASDTSVREGSEVTLNWVSTGNVDSVSINNGIGAVALTGSQAVTINNTTTYDFTISGLNSTQNCAITIEATTGGGGGGSASPRCELEISASRIDRGDEVTLTWETRSTRELTLTDDQGNVLVTTEDKLSDDKEELFDSSITVSPTRDTTYTLLVERGSRDRECTVDVELDDDIVLLQTRDQAPLVAGISLTEVPYTGFEAGPIMTTLFYTLLVAWALYITYVLVIPKQTLAPAKVAVREDINSTEDLMKQAEGIRPDVFAPIASTPVVTSAAPTQVAPSNLPTGVTDVFETEVAPQSHVAQIEETTVEQVAHGEHALLSSDAVKSFIAGVPADQQLDKLKEVIATAKTEFPLEDGWVVINHGRMMKLLMG